jgi:branched-chain amino acid transport system substrate-binding protein
VLQGRILGNQIIEDGSATVGILALQDAYGTGLAENIEKSVTGSNGEVVETIIYDPKAAEFTAEVSQLKGADPEAIVVIGFDESAKVIQELAKQGIGPQDGKKLYLVDGNTGNALGEKLPAGLLAGVKGTIPGAAAGAEFQARSRRSTRPEGLQLLGRVLRRRERRRPRRPRGRERRRDRHRREPHGRHHGGEKCTTFADCKELAEAGTDFDYDGLSGPIEFDENGDPTEASVGVYEYDANEHRSRPPRRTTRAASSKHSRTAARARAGSGPGPLGARDVGPGPPEPCPGPLRGRLPAG